MNNVNNKSFNELSERFSELEQHFINLELALQQNLEAQLQDKDIAIRVIPTTSVSRPQLKSNRLEDRVMHNNSEGKKQQVEDHHRNFKFSNNKTSVTACNDSLNAKTSNITPPGYKWKPNSRTMNVEPNVSMHLGTKSRTTNISEPTTLRKSTVSNTPSSSNPFAARTVKFRNDQIAPILGYGDLVQGNVTIKRVYYVDGLNHNLFFVGQFCDVDLEVAFRKSTYYICDLKGNDLLTNSRGTDLYSITLQDTSTPNPIFLMAKVSSSQAWLWHRRLSHLNFDTINLLSKYDIVTGLPKLKFVKDHLCSSCELGKVKQETPEVLIDFLKLVQRGLYAQVRTIRTDKGMKFLNKTLHAYFAQEGIGHQTSTARTPKQNGVVERRNCTLVEVARTMLSAANVPLFFWAEAIATSCFTQNRSLVIPQHEKMTYHTINGQKLSVKFFHIFRSLCYIIKDGKNLDKMKEKGPCRFLRNVPQAAETVTTSNELDLLFSSMFGELLNGTTQVLSKSSAVTATDSPNQRQQQKTTPSTLKTVDAGIPPLNIQTTLETTSQAPTQAPTITANENIIQAKINKEYAQVDKDEFINIFSTPVQERGETSSRYVNSSNMHTFYQRHPSENC
ncbi:integrase, catalytic region, zinc finger, CCHC-type containing protein [Tanacetum coccineum]